MTLLVGCFWVVAGLYFMHVQFGQGFARSLSKGEAFPRDRP